jgi:Domain of unknown function (DUF4352)
MSAKMRALLVVSLGAFALISAGASSCSSSNGGSGSSGGNTSGGSTKSSSAGCGTKATDNCTPHVGSHGTVTVDALEWRLISAKTAHTIGDPASGLGAKANGVFVIVKMKVHSKKTDSATLTSDVIKLEAKGKKYDTDSNGSTAAIGAGQQPFFLNTIGPDSDVTGTAVFDVPPAVLAKRPEIRVNELGFSPPHGYIALPRLSSG